MPFPGAQMYHQVQHLHETISLDKNPTSYSASSRPVQVSQNAHHRRQNQYRAENEMAR